ncbi:P-loop containing nucleoside triphosphate hydrolase protein [Xylariaceae sp. FL0594]|nr:P-loop containing nucleoside triphosphate hydrolase protein [Xylariaceae sp. FL0594]
MPDGPPLLASAGLGLGVVSVFSLLSVIHLVRQTRSPTQKTEGYEDQDGISSEEAVKNFSTKLPKAAIVILSIIGLCTSIVLAVLSTISPRGKDHGLFTENWLAVAAWALLTFQAACIAASRSSVDAYNLGIYSSLSSIVLAAVLAVQDTRVAAHLLRHDEPVFAIRLVEIITVVCLAFSSLTIPRRPDVFYKGEVVDRLYTCSAWSRFNWSWPSSILGLASTKKNLDMSDLPRPSHYVRAGDATAEWESYNFTRPLWISVILAHKWGFALQWALSLVTAVLNFAPQWVVLQILHLLERREQHERIGYEGWVWAIWLLVAITAQSWVETHIFWLSWCDICIPIRAQLSSLVFRKALRRKDVKEAGKKKATMESTDPLSALPAGESGTTGQPEADSDDGDAEQLKQGKQSTVNLIGVDAKRVSDFANFNWFIPSSIFKLAVSLVFLTDLLGWKPLVFGFCTMLVVTPFNAYCSKKYSAAQDKLMKVRDEKMEVVSEALQGIRQIKFAALEPQWEAKIKSVRDRELKCVWNAFFFDVMLIGCWIASPILLAAVSLAVYASIHGDLIPSVAFVSLSIFKGLELTLSVIPELTTDALDAWVSINRIDNYLRGAEVSPDIAQESDEISFDNATIAWPSDSDAVDSSEETDRFILRDVSATFPKGELSVISGKTGSGKSLMLAAILGEVDLLSGTISKPRVPPLEERHDSKANRENWIIPSAIAYVAQIPWVENATVKDNILFGLPYDEHRYKKTVDVCALTKDIEMLSDGEETEIGANGINLSGGQKWRITLARAIYSRAGILVMDDIFSAVDAHVGRHIFEKCLNGELGLGRTRILVTHHVALCESKTNYLIELGDGGVLHSGLVSEMEEAGTMEQIKSQEPAEQGLRDDEEATAVNSEQTSQLGSEASGDPLVKVPSKAGKPRKFVEEEKREEGAIKRRVYAIYLKYSGSWPFWIGAVLLFLSVQGLTLGRSWWLRIWTGTYEEEGAQPQLHLASGGSQTYMYPYTFQQPVMGNVTRPTSVDSGHSLNFYLGVYVGLAVGSSVVDTFKWYYIFSGSIRASRELFARLNFVILRAPLRWLDTVPVGRILNRFTADFHSVDTHLAYAVAYATNAFLNLLGVVVAGLFVSPILIVMAFVLLGICLMFAIRYLHAARSVKRMESIAKSPVFEQFGSALTGVLTIRAFTKSETYIDRMCRRIDDWSTTTWHLWLFNRWMGWRMSLVGGFFATLVTVFILLRPDMDSALAGFALSFALQFSGYVTWTIRHYSNAELEMNAAERIVEYSELPTEDLKGASPPAAWPTEGRVEVNDLVVAYADDLPPVLKGLNFSINRNERVGVIGRTGAGKSSLTLALFRFVEARSGNILIDGIDISKIKLHDLRSRLAIIPQDPVLFSGTVRSNLDPFDDHTDTELFDCLARVHLISENETSPGTPLAPGSEEGQRTNGSTNAGKKNTNIFRNLSSPISEGGLNLSQGQRQLLCLARAIVSRPKVMVLDEATSAVDMATDALIQRSIREEFGDSTLIVIAHRLSTIADFDRILVLSDGKVAEFGTPRELWETGERGIFRGMCEQSGEREHLRRIVYGETTAVEETTARIP